MKVKRAAQILSSSVATGLRMEREEEYRRRLMLCYESRRQSHITGESLPFTRAEVLDYAQTKELEVYIGVFNRMLDIMNARTPVVDVNVAKNKGRVSAPADNGVASSNTDH